MSRTKQEIRDILINNATREGGVLFVDNTDLAAHELMEHKDLIDGVDCIVTANQNKNYTLTLTQDSQIKIPQTWMEQTKKHSDDLYHMATKGKELAGTLVYDNPYMTRSSSLFQEGLDWMVEEIQKMDNKDAYAALTALMSGLHNNPMYSGTYQGMEVTFSMPATKDVIFALEPTAKSGDVIGIKDNRGVTELEIRKPIGWHDIMDTVRDVVSQAKYAVEIEAHKTQQTYTIEKQISDKQQTEFSVRVDDNGHAHIMCPVNAQTEAVFPIRWSNENDRTNELNIARVHAINGKIYDVELSNNNPKDIADICNASVTYQQAADFLRAESRELIPNAYPELACNQDVLNTTSIKLPKELLNADTVGMESSWKGTRQFVINDLEYNADIYQPTSFSKDDEYTIVKFDNLTLNDSVIKELQKSLGENMIDMQHGDIVIRSQDKQVLSKVFDGIEAEHSNRYIDCEIDFSGR